MPSESAEHGPLTTQAIVTFFPSRILQTHFASNQLLALRARAILTARQTRADGNLSESDMAPSEADTDTSSRGIKRKLSGGEVRLTPSQRLAAARKLANVEVSSLDTEKSRGQAESKRDDDEYYRNLYVTEPDFAVLGGKDKEFGACLIGGRHLDFTDPASVMQLTKTLLKQDFCLQVDLPNDRLCPPVPNRHNYILWLKDLLDTSSVSYSDTYEPDRKVTGLDIGTGSSAIYPLLGCVQRPWSFIATDIDSKSLTYARKNVELNSLTSRIRIVERPVKDALIPLDDLGIDRIDFVMTNPPFYTSESELLGLAEQKSKPPSSVCTGAPNEMVCDGGEVGFIRRIIDESLLLKDRVQWYTTMLGKHSSLEVIIELLKEHDIDNYAVAKFVQGNKTRRWAIGWSFINRRPSVKASRGLEQEVGKKILPPPAEFTVASKSTRRGGAEQLENIFWTQLEDITDGLDLVSLELDEDRLRVVGFADQNVWSRAYRRSKSKQFPAGRAPEQGKAAKGAPGCAFGFSISIQTQKALGDEKDDTVGVVVRWLQGTDYSMFESFFGMLRTALLHVI